MEANWYDGYFMDRDTEPIEDTVVVLPIKERRRRSRSPRQVPRQVLGNTMMWNNMWHFNNVTGRWYLGPPKSALPSNNFWICSNLSCPSCRRDQMHGGPPVEPFNESCKQIPYILQLTTLLCQTTRCFDHVSIEQRRRRTFTRCMLG